MSAKLLIVALLVLLILGLAIFLYPPGVSTLHVDPHAAEEIEKAKQR